MIQKVAKSQIPIRCSRQHWLGQEGKWWSCCSAQCRLLGTSSMWHPPAALLKPKPTISQQMTNVTFGTPNELFEARCPGRWSSQFICDDLVAPDLPAGGLCGDTSDQCGDTLSCKRGAGGPAGLIQGHVSYLQLTAPILQMHTTPNSSSWLNPLCPWLWKN